VSLAPPGRRVRIVALFALSSAVGAWMTQAEPVSRHPHFLANTPSVIAHAGAQGHAPPNTIEAFALAIELGADALEMDLQMTSGGHVVTMHDGTVDRTTDGRGRVTDFSLADLRELDAGWSFEDDVGGFPYRGRGVRVPTLVEVFEAFPGTLMILEMKTDSGDGIVEAVAELVRRHRREDTVLVASFDRGYLQRFRALAPGVPTNMAEDEIRTFHVLHLAGLHRWWRAPGQFFQVPEYHDDTHVATPRFIRAAGRLGVDVHVWTVNEPQDMRRLLDAGAHGIITDYPNRLRTVVDGR
jgi:glycerophosphoryl diester phosphodiesterase